MSEWVNVKDIGEKGVLYLNVVMTVFKQLGYLFALKKRPLSSKHVALLTLPIEERLARLALSLPSFLKKIQQ